jgi:hypothetical protein
MPIDTLAPSVSIQRINLASRRFHLIARRHTLFLWLCVLTIATHLMHVGIEVIKAPGNLPL